jgi:hypothetical protein
MPADDLVLNVRQIAGYTPTSNAPTSAALLMQLAGLGSAYASISPAALVGTALAQGGDMAVGGQISALAIQGGAAQFSNGAFGLLGAQKACITNLTATFGSIGGVRIATVADLSALAAATVTSFNGRQGAVCLWIQDIISAGGAPNFSPVFGGEPRAPTPGPTSNSSRLATTAFVAGAIGALTLDFAPLASPNFTGVPTAPTAPLGSSDGTLATTAFVQNAIASSVAGVSSFNTRTGIVTLTNADVTAAGGAVLNSPAFTGTPTAPTPPPGDISTRIATTAFVLTESGFAPLASPAFTGTPTAPTPTPGTNTTQLATTAYVQAAITGISLGVTTFNGRSGAVTLVANDITAAGGAILASPAFTGTPTAPNPPPGDSSTRIATTAYVQSLAGFAPLASPAFTGVPTGPTAAPGNNTTQLATTAFVEAAVANSTTGVASFNGRTGAVTLQANDISAAGGALLASPLFTGTPAGPTAALGTNTTQLATTAFVTAAISAQGGPFLPLAGGALTGALTSSSGATFGATVQGVDLVATGGVFSQSGFVVSRSNTPVVELQNAATTNVGQMTWLSASGQVQVSNPNGGGFLGINITPAFVVNCTPFSPAGGPWTSSSDARIKTVDGDYELGLDEVLGLRPVVFRYKGNDTDVAPETRGAGPHKTSMHYLVAQKRAQFVGLIAQEVEPIFPGMVTKRAGFIDGQAVDDIRDLNANELTFALVNAVKALAARVAALEG